MLLNDKNEGEILKLRHNQVKKVLIKFLKIYKKIQSKLNPAANRKHLGVNLKFFIAKYSLKIPLQQKSLRKRSS